MSEIIAGIDLGTTNSEIAICDDRGVRVLSIDGSPIMPSCVGIDPAGKLVVGQTAKNQMVSSPESTILSIKRNMGEANKVKMGGKEFSPEEISSLILRELKLAAEKQLGQTLKKVIITVPAFFSEQQRKATQTAGQLAGLEVVRIINEPTAAALAYGAGSKEGEKILVYDLGGGTFDVSVVVVEQGIVEVKASHGDTHLGGDDFDQLLVDYAVKTFQRQQGQLKLEPRILRRLKSVMEEAKRKLSDQPYVSVREEFIDGERHLEMELDRQVYESMIMPLLERTLTCVRQSLEDAGLQPGDIDKVMLVGGATRTPLVQKLLKARFGFDPRFEINPDLIVAMGAAIQGGTMAGRKTNSILVDITPHTYSTAVHFTDDDDSAEMHCLPIIPRNTPLPVSKSDVVYTRHDNQETINTTVCQGEGHLLHENRLVGEFQTTGLSKVTRGNPVIIKYDLDVNGMLHVTATEKATGLSKTVTLDTKGVTSLDFEEARQNIAALTGEPIPSPQGAGSESAPEENTERKEFLTAARDLRKRAEEFLKQNPDSADAADIKEMLSSTATAIKEGTLEKVQKNNDVLSDLLFYLEV